MSREAVFIAALVCASPAWAETAYFSAIPDVPIAPGLDEVLDPVQPSIVAWGSELTLASAHGRTSPEDVARFYRESLSPLGWSFEPSPRAQDLAFIRGRERLNLHIEAQDEGTFLRVRLIVQPASMDAD